MATGSRHRSKWVALACAGLTFCLDGCANRYQNVALGIGIGGAAPINEIEQIYYLGVFDPRGQIAPQVYRIRVHGQSSLGGGKFASGWVPASVIDTLNLPAIQDAANDPTGMGLGPAGDGGSFLGGRKLVAFGPQGFRDVPQNHRLVMVMGNNADQFFQAISETLGTVSNTRIQIKNASLNDDIFRALTDLLREKVQLIEFRHTESTP